MGFENLSKQTRKEETNKLNYDDDTPRVYTKEEISSMSDSQREYLKKIQAEEASWDKEDDLEFKEKKIGFFEGRELKKTKDILNKKMEKNNKEDEQENIEAEKLGSKIDEKRNIRIEGYKELEKDKKNEEIDIEKTFKRLNEEGGRNRKENVYECLIFSNAGKSLEMEREWRGKIKGMSALLDTENKSLAEKKGLYVEAYLKEMPFTKEDGEETRQKVLNYLNMHAERMMNSGSVKIKKEVKQLNEEYKKEDEKMLRLRELINKKYFRDDQKKQEDINLWRREREESINN